jgi:hypothetical protein
VRQDIFFEHQLQKPASISEIDKDQTTEITAPADPTYDLDSIAELVESDDPDPDPDGV